MRIGSLCSGAGMLDLAAEKVFGAETAWHCEIDVAASKVLAARWDVPNYHDLTATDWSTVEPVDVAAAGWPCQPWSLAGKKKGASDERAIWPEIARAVRELRPRYVFLENVSAVVVLGELARAAGDLAQIGYDAQWTCISASEVGACHKRERFFVLATDTTGGSGQDITIGSNASRFSVGAVAVAGGGDCRGDSSEGVPVLAGVASELATVTPALLPTPRTSDANGSGAHGQGGMDLRTAVTNCASQWGKYALALSRWEQVWGRPAPPMTERNGRSTPRLSARFVEWMMGLPAGWVTDVDLPRSAQLKILGNGVVVQQAEAALRYLLSVAEVAA